LGVLKERKDSTRRGRKGDQGSKVGGEKEGKGITSAMFPSGKCVILLIRLWPADNDRKRVSGRGSTDNLDEGERIQRNAALGKGSTEKEKAPAI